MSKSDNRLYEKSFWELRSLASGQVRTTGYITRKAAVATGTKWWGFTGMEVKSVPQVRGR